MKKIFVKNLLDRNTWITPVEAKRYIIFSEMVIRKKFIELIKSDFGKDIVCTKTLRNGKTLFFINKHKIREFAELTGLILRQDAKKTNDWLDTNDIFKIVYGSKHAIKTLIHKYAKTHPDAVQYKIINGKKESCLCIANKNDFIKTYNLQIRTDKEWLGAYDLKKQFTVQYPTILKHMRSLAPHYPSEIQYIKHHSNTTLCIRYDFINQFAALTNFQLYSSKDTKTEQWLNADEIGYTIHRDHHIILKNIRKLYSEHSPLVSLKLNKKRWVLCVNKNDLKEFLTQTGIQPKNNQKLVSLYQRQR